MKRSAERELTKLAADVRQRITEAIDKLKTSPRPRHSEKLEGANDLRRIRVGDYRVIYTIMKSVLVIQIIRIRHRRDVYRRQ